MLVNCADSVTSEPESSWSGGGDGKADIYGEDSRREVNDPSVPDQVRSRARSVALVFNTQSIFDVTEENVLFSGFTLNDKVTRDTGAPLCEEEAFSKQPAPGYCTAFLIAPDLVATAGHCINGHTRCEQMGFAFDYAKKSASEETRLVDQNNFYRCEELIGRVYNPREEPEALASREYWYDWAVIRLNRPVLDRDPVQLMEGERLKRGDALHVLGHPMGIAMKLTEGRVVTDDKDRYMNSDVDIYQGNSGSPVFDTETGAVHGIVIRGSGGNSFEITREGCSRSKHCDQVGDPECIGNHLLRVDPLRVFTQGELKVVERHSLVEDDTSTPGYRHSFVFEGETRVSFTTLHINAGAQDSTKLRVILHHDGQSVTMMNHPVNLPYGRWTASTEEFAGQKLGGEWIIEVIDDGGARVFVEWAQVMVGVRE